MSVEEALQLWGNVSERAGLVGAPVMCKNPLTAGSWLQNFTSGFPTPKIDFIPVHWYKGTDSKLFIRDIQAICNMFGKPVWVTEFAPQTCSSARENPTKYTQA